MRNNRPLLPFSIMPVTQELVRLVAVAAPFAMVLGIVIVRRFFEFEKLKLEHERRKLDAGVLPGNAQNGRLETELRELRDRIEALETIAVSTERPMSRLRVHDDYQDASRSMPAEESASAAQRRV